MKYKLEIVGTYDILDGAIVFDYNMEIFKFTPIFTDTATALEKETSLAMLDNLSKTMKESFLNVKPSKILELNADKLVLSTGVTFRPPDLYPSTILSIK